MSHECFQQSYINTLLHETPRLAPIINVKRGLACDTVGQIIRRNAPCVFVDRRTPRWL